MRCCGASTHQRPAHQKGAAPPLPLKVKRRVVISLAGEVGAVLAVPKAAPDAVITVSSSGGGFVLYTGETRTDAAV